MAGDGTTSDDPIVADARAALSTWARPLVRKVKRLSIVAVVVLVVSAFAADRMTRWRHDLLVSGVRTNGVVDDIRFVRDKSSRHDDVHILVAEPATSFTLWTPHGVYREGERLTVYVDPTNARRARTDRYVTDDGVWTRLVGVVPLLSLGALAIALIAGWHLGLVFVLARRLHRTEVTAQVRMKVSFHSPRRILLFADTGDVLWSTVAHERMMRTGECVVGGRHLWRFVWWPNLPRPYLLRRPHTPVGASRWRRALRDGSRDP